MIPQNQGLWSVGYQCQPSVKICSFDCELLAYSSLNGGMPTFFRLAVDCRDLRSNRFGSVVCHCIAGKDKANCSGSGGSLTAALWQHQPCKDTLAQLCVFVVMLSVPIDCMCDGIVMAHVSFLPYVMPLIVCALAATPPNPI